MSIGGSGRSSRNDRLAFFRPCAAVRMLLKIGSFLEGAMVPCTVYLNSPAHLPSRTASACTGSETIVNIYRNTESPNTDRATSFVDYQTPSAFAHGARPLTQHAVFETSSSLPYLAGHREIPPPGPSATITVAPPTPPQTSDNARSGRMVCICPPYRTQTMTTPRIHKKKTTDTARATYHS